MQRRFGLRGDSFSTTEPDLLAPLIASQTRYGDKKLLHTAGSTGYLPLRPGSCSEGCIKEIYFLQSGGTLIPNFSLYRIGISGRFLWEGVAGVPDTLFTTPPNTDGLAYSWFMHHVNPASTAYIFDKVRAIFINEYPPYIVC